MGIAGIPPSYTGCQNRIWLHEECIFLNIKSAFFENRGTPERVHSPYM